MKRGILSVAGALVLLAPATALAQIAQEEVDLAVVEQIREEGFERSQLIETPPSEPRIRWSEFSGLIQSAWWSRWTPARTTP